MDEPKTTQGWPRPGGSSSRPTSPRSASRPAAPAGEPRLIALGVVLMVAGRRRRRSIAFVVSGSQSDTRDVLSA